jgi:hypothetical protein
MMIFAARRGGHRYMTITPRAVDAFANRHIGPDAQSQKEM